MADYPVLTEEGRKKLEDELKKLKEVKRKEIKKRIELAKDHGDLSENADYQDAREEQAFIEGRILEIENVLKSAVTAPQSDRNGIRIGSKVVVEVEGQTVQYNIVGSHETNPEQGLISCDSPLGQAFLGHFIGDKVEVETPKGEVVYQIKEVK
ncbi:transcription elongation factor GreA [Patescibacteria group bacterium]|nr:transcription elongation factor GreA [Patescibacteria group bacterium]